MLLGDHFALIAICHTISQRFLKISFSSLTPLMGDRLVTVVGLWAPRILQSPLLEIQGEERTKSMPVFRLLEPSLRGAKISGTPSSTYVTGFGSTANCEHSQELIPGLLEFKATSVFTAFTYIRLHCKYKYKIAIKNAAAAFEWDLDDELSQYYLAKDTDKFWKKWQS